MTAKSKVPFRKRRLFPRTLQEVVKDATQPLMNKQGKMYGALLRDWPEIVGVDRARVTRPQRLQYPNSDATGGVLHLAVRPAAAPELAYATEQMLEQCARYFGYRAVERIVLHPTHGAFDAAPMPLPQATKSATPQAIPAHIPSEMKAVLARIAAHIASVSDKKE